LSLLILSVRNAEDLPDDYFTPTLADLKERQAQLHARATSLNNAPLLTRTQREQQTKTKRDRWPNVISRPFRVNRNIIHVWGLM
jgi:hypothetical protein